MGQGKIEGGKGHDDVERQPLLSDGEAARAKVFGFHPAVVSGICYCCASGSMVILNKHALAGFGWTAANALLFFQCALSVIMVKGCESMRLIKPLQPLKADLVKVWLPVNIIFVCMIASSFLALQTVGVGMVTVWKNLSNFLTALGDVFIFGKSYSWQVWGCLFLMTGSALAGASTDSQFTFSGYTWQVVNCVFTSAYALYLRSVMDKVAEHTTDKKRMDENSMVYYNNLLSLPFIALLMLIFNEYPKLTTPAAVVALQNPTFLSVATLGGVIGFAISFSSLWFLSQTTATLYSLVGALNKIPVAVVGILVFAEPTNPKNLASIIIGLTAGVLFVFAKARGAK